jgi:hypothetical protein
MVMANSFDGVFEVSSDLGDGRRSSKPARASGFAAALLDESPRGVRRAYGYCGHSDPDSSDGIAR